MTAQNQDFLSALLAPKNEDVTKTVFMKRFGIDFVIKAITNDEMDKIRQRATRLTGKGQKSFDEDLFNYLTVVKACVVPNWEDPKVVEALGATDSIDALRKRLLFGEFAQLLNEVAELNGFDKTDEEEIEEIKN